MAFNWVMGEILDRGSEGGCGVIAKLAGQSKAEFASSSAFSPDTIIFKVGSILLTII
jgi:hypothetical protein